MNEKTPGGRTPLPPLAIVGIGSLFPKAHNAEEFWALIKSGADAITEVPASHWRPEDYFSEDKKKPDFTYAKRGGFLEPYPFDPLKFGVPPNALEATDTSQLLGMVAADQAMADAGYGSERPFDRDRASVILGVTGALELVIPLGARLGHPLWRAAMLEAGLTHAQADDIVQRIGDRYVPWQENSFPGLLGNVVAGRISKYLDTGGTNCVVDAACASSLGALELAALELATGKADLAITGGVDTFNDIFMYLCFSKTPALSPTGDARPFDEHSDGTILGEGLGMVVLKRLADAERDGDRIYAVIRGVGSSSDGKGDAIYAPSAPGQVKALRDAYASAGISPDAIDLVEAHGTGTARGDAVETGALREVFGELGGRAPWCAVGSIKSQIGHTKAAAGAAGMIKAALALHHKVLPPTIKVEQPAESVAPGVSPLYVNTAKRPWLPRAGRPRRAGVSSFGFGGSNFHVILEEYAAKKAAPDWDGAVQIFAYSGANAVEITAKLDAIRPEIAWNEWRDAAASSRAAFDPAQRCRLVFAIDKSRADRAALLSSLRKRLGDSPETAWSLPDGAYYGVGAPEGAVAILFPGQGAQYPGMLRDLACLFPEMLDALATADAALGEDTRGARLSDLIYPHPAFDDATRQAQDAALRATAAAQPALGAVALGAFGVLRRFGVDPAAFAGHSYGELAALCAAGAFGADDLARISKRRGELMDSGAGERGTMLAVRAGVAEIEGFVRENGLDVTLANKNAPDQVVLSGASEAIARAADLFASKKIHATPLNVAAAFHSALVADAAIPFGQALAGVEFHTTASPVYANTTAGVYPADAGAARQLLANQLARPVEFVAEIMAMHASGVRTFIEAGPGARLTSLVGQILAGKPHTAVAMDSSNGKRDGVIDLARALCALAAEGRACDLRTWDGEHRPTKEPAGGARRMIVPLCGANYRSELSRPKPRPAILNTAASSGNESRQTAGAREQDAHPTGAGALRRLDAPSPALRAPLAMEGTLGDLFRQTQASLAALQQLQEQTARLHAQYLQGQETTTRAFQQLVEQQERLFDRAVEGGVPMPASRQVTDSAVQASSCLTARAPETDRTLGVDLAEMLLEVVSEKTGYPREMLEPGMALDADLGIDSIKRVEILSALQERVPQLPTLAAEELGGIQTLADVVRLLSEKGGVIASVTPAPAQGAALDRMLLEIVAEKTGYPQEMLGLDMALDADLGIDSIKRVEILSALQERMPQLPTLGADELGAIHTLRDIVARLASVALTAPAKVQPSAQPLETLLLCVVAEKTGYPAEMLGLDMALDADLGIDSIKRVEILSALQERVPGLPAVEAEALASLVTLRDVVRAMSAPHTPAGEKAPIASARRAVAQDVPLECRVTGQGLRRVPLRPARERARDGLVPGTPIAISGASGEFGAALARVLTGRGFAATVIEPGRPTAATSLVVLAADAPDAEWARRAFETVKAFGSKADSAEGGFIACVTRLDGAFGLRNPSLVAHAETGALAGLAKTAAREWPDLNVRAIDLAPDFASVDTAAEALADELLAEGPVETGIAPDGATTLVLQPRSRAQGGKNAVALTSQDVIVITGGARGVTAAVAEAMARAGRPKLALVGRSAVLVAEPEWLRAARDERAIKKVILEHAAEKLSPQDVERRYREAVAAREGNETLKRIRTAGAEVRYYAADVRDAKQLREALEHARAELGPITGIVHGAGVIADRRIEDKTVEQFDVVYGTKVDGLRNLMSATAGDPLRCIVLFSSSTGRFGRVGQSDYAMANEALNKIARAEAARREHCRVLSINWGPWDGGMVTPALRKVFAAEGVGVIGLEAGAQFLLDELAAGGDEVEIVALAGLQPEAAPARPMNSALTIELSADRFPFLASHVIDGHSVLPVAMYVEWMAHAAAHANPGLRFVGIEDLRVLNGVVLDREAPLALEIAAGAAVGSEGCKRVPVEMRGAGPGGRRVLHSTAIVLLDTSFGEGAAALAGRTLPAYRASRDDIYNHQKLFHGPMFQGIVTVDGCGEDGISITASAAPAPETWIREPLRRRWLADPLALDCAFQAMILWSLDRFETASLPVRLGKYEQFQTAFPKGGVRVEAKIVKATNFGATATIEFLHAGDGTLVARIEDYECIMAASLNAAFQRNQIAQPARE
jgi:acyl transferase domain-containing protein/NAD(P)-dependent dehydrogenase (short-subunit alcohol dehydrogenase family)